MKTIKILFTALLLMVSIAGFAQASGQTDAERLAEYQNKVRQTLQLDYSMPDYTETSIKAKVMGSRLAKIIEKTLEMSMNPSILGVLFILQGRRIDGLDSCAIRRIQLDKVTKRGIRTNSI